MHPLTGMILAFMVFLVPYESFCHCDTSNSNCAYTNKNHILSIYHLHPHPEACPKTYLGFRDLPGPVALTIDWQLHVPQSLTLHVLPICDPTNDAQPSVVQRSQ